LGAGEFLARQYVVETGENSIRWQGIHPIQYVRPHFVIFP
jgi:hypothetical protein